MTERSTLNGNFVIKRKKDMKHSVLWSPRVQRCYSYTAPTMSRRPDNKVHCTHKMKLLMKQYNLSFKHRNHGNRSDCCHVITPTCQVLFICAKCSFERRRVFATLRGRPKCIPWNIKNYLFKLAHALLIIYLYGLMYFFHQKLIKVSQCLLIECILSGYEKRPQKDWIVRLKSLVCRRRLENSQPAHI